VKTDVAGDITKLAGPGDRLLHSLGNLSPFRLAFSEALQVEASQIVFLKTIGIAGAALLESVSSPVLVTG